MKKIYILLSFLIVFALLLTACGGADAPAEAAEVAAEADPAPAEAVVEDE